MQKDKEIIVILKNV